MKTIYRILILCLCLASCFSIQAAESAAQVLKNTTAKVDAAKSLAAAFTAISTNGAAAEGKLTISRHKFAMTGSDFGAWYDGENLWSYSKQAGETSLSNPTTEELLEINPFDIINHYYDFFNASIASQTSDAYKIELNAKSSYNTVSRAVITISKTTWLPTAIAATFSNGSSIDIKITSMVEGKVEPDPTTFTYPVANFIGVPIIDLR